MDVSGTLTATGASSGQTGGSIQITGNRVVLESPTYADVSGAAGGGTLYIGGNAHGIGPLANAAETFVNSGASLIADAGTTGNGGTIIVWSNNYTEAGGNLSAQGGAVSGNGGFIETSSHDLLNINGVQINLLAKHGATGLWLLDPSNVTISASVTSNETTPLATNGSATYVPTVNTTSTISNTELAGYLATANITVSTSGVAGGNAGTITVSNPITWYAPTTLTLQADSTIAINAAITAPSGGLVLTAGSSGAAISASAAVNVYNFSITQGAWSQKAASISALPVFTVTNNLVLAPMQPSFVPAAQPIPGRVVRLT